MSDRSQLKFCSSAVGIMKLNSLVVGAKMREKIVSSAKYFSAIGLNLNLSGVNANVD